MRTTLLLCSFIFAACGSASMTPVDSGSNGPCDTAAQSGCGSGQKCSVNAADGTPHCVATGSKAAYDSCASDTDCIGGTTCINTPANASFQGGTQVCHPICDPATGAHLSCPMGGSCEIQDLAEANIGFCVLPVQGDGGP